jgi:hypothetical protein
MFLQARVFNADISKWNTAAAVSMVQMLGSAQAFDRNIGDWNVASVAALTGAPSQSFASLRSPRAGAHYFGCPPALRD